MVRCGEWDTKGSPEPLKHQDRKVQKVRKYMKYIIVLYILFKDILFFFFLSHNLARILVSF